MNITRIRIPAKWSITDGCSVLPCAGTADFKLGPGPCGKEVVSLDIDFGDTLLTVYQYHADQTKKAFTYRTADLYGRVEVDYG